MYVYISIQFNYFIGKKVVKSAPNTSTHTLKRKLEITEEINLEQLPSTSQSVTITKGSQLDVTLSGKSLKKGNRLIGLPYIKINSYFSIPIGQKSSKNYMNPNTSSSSEISEPIIKTPTITYKRKKKN